MSTRRRDRLAVGHGLGVDVGGAMGHGSHRSGELMEYGVFEGGYALFERLGVSHGVMVRAATDNSTDFRSGVVKWQLIAISVSQNGNRLRSRKQQAAGGRHASVVRVRSVICGKLVLRLGAITRPNNPICPTQSQYMLAEKPRTDHEVRLSG